MPLKDEIAGKSPFKFASGNRRYFAQKLVFSDNGFKYGDDVSLLEEDIVDSLGIMDLVFFVEESFDILVEDEELTPDNFATANKLAGYVQRQHMVPA